MYNLFVSASAAAWNGEPWEIEMGRCVREFTAAPLTERFGALDDNAVTALKGMPSLFAHETANQQPARLGWITRIRHRANSALIEYELEQALPAIPQARLLELQWDLDLTDWEMNRTHWALKDVDLFPVLVEAGVLDAAALRAQPLGSRIALHGLGQTPDIEARPRVFRIPAVPPDASLVSVMMPFAPQFGAVYAVLGATCAQLGLRCERADNVWQENEIIQDIFLSFIGRRSCFAILQARTRTCSTKRELLTRLAKVSSPSLRTTMTFPSI